MTTEFGTPEYVAPEVWKGEEFKYEPDIFALGIIIHEILLCGIKPFTMGEAGVEELAEVIMGEEFNPTQINTIDYIPITPLVQNMLCKDRKQRIKIDQVLSTNIYIYIYI